MTRPTRRILLENDRPALLPRRTLPTIKSTYLPEAHQHSPLKARKEQTPARDDDHALWHRLDGQERERGGSGLEEEEGAGGERAGEGGRDGGSTGDEGEGEGGAEGEFSRLRGV